MTVSETVRDRATGIPPRPVPVLMYHSIDTHASPGFSRFVVAPGTFRAHLDYLAEHGFSALTAGALARARRCGEPLPQRPVVLTFDDAYSDFHAIALPELLARGFTATLFVPTAYVGKSARWLRGCDEQDRLVLPWSALQEVVGAGVEVGAHSHTHPQLDRVPADRARAEAVDSRRLLEDALGSVVRGFAYPFGYWNRTARRAVAAAGYGYACQVGELTSGPGDNALSLPRHTVNAGTDVRGLTRLLGLQPTPAARVGSSAKRVVWRTARRLPRLGGDPLEGSG